MFRMLRAFSFIVISFTSSASAEEACPDLTLVLAIDSSSSINDAEFALEIGGYAAAFRNPMILQALSDVGRVDIAVIFWAGLENSGHIMAWQAVKSDADAGLIAGWFLATRRDVRGDTEIGNGLGRALDLIDRHETCGRRRVVDVSGDGRGNHGSSRGPPRITLASARTRADTMGVVVNGLAIANEEPDLGQYYRDELITGAGCFAMEVSSFDDFARAIVEKLKHEIKPRYVASLVVGDTLRGKPEMEFKDFDAE